MQPIELNYFHDKNLALFFFIMKYFLSIAIILSNLVVLLANQRALKISGSIGFVAFIKVKPRAHAHKKVFNSLDLHGTLKIYLTPFM